MVVLKQIFGVVSVEEVCTSGDSMDVCAVKTMCVTGEMCKCINAHWTVGGLVVMAITSTILSIIERVAIGSVARTTIVRLVRNFGRPIGPIVGVLGGPTASRVGVAIERELGAGDTTTHCTRGNIS